MNACSFLIIHVYACMFGLPGGTSGKEPTCQSERHRDLGSIPGVGRSPGGGNGRLEAKRIKSPVRCNNG